MRLQVEVWREDEDPLRILAIKQRPRTSVRELCALFIHLKLQEELARLKLEDDPDLVPVG